MANNKRETKRERRDEAKRRRLEELRRRERRARLRRLGIFGALAAAVAGIILLVSLLGGGGNPAESNRLAEAAGCKPVENPPIITTLPSHINPPAKATYNTNPPASGQHYNAQGFGPLTTGIHRAPVEYEGSVHNLEHGAIVIYYKESIEQSTANVLADVVRSNPEWIMLAPNTSMPTTIAFTAWGHLQECDAPVEAGLEAAAKDFVKRFRNKAPESLRGTPEPGTDIAVPPVSAVTGSPSPSPSPSVSPSPSPTATGT